MSRPDLILMGRASGAFGVKGEIRIFLHGQDPEVLARSGLIYLGPNPEAARPMTVASQRTHAGRVLLTAREVTTREQAAALAGQWVYVRREALAPLAEDEYYWFQLKGALVTTVAGRQLGQVVAVGKPGPHDMLLVRAADGKEALIPVVDQVITAMDLEAARITVDLPEGLLEAQGWDEEGAEAGTDE
ncbi:MAG: ribosome maturation factor RimM [Pseudomonadota bacterium]